MWAACWAPGGLFIDTATLEPPAIPVCVGEQPPASTFQERKLRLMISQRLVQGHTGGVAQAVGGRGNGLTEAWLPG